MPVLVPCHNPTCIVCSNHSDLEYIEGAWRFKMNKEHKMTREEAVKKVNVDKDRAFNTLDELFIARLEALGLIKFEEKREVKKIFSVNEPGRGWDAPNTSLINLNNIVNKYGPIRLEEWPEGLVLWVGDKIVYKSWEKQSDWPYMEKEEIISSVF